MTFLAFWLTALQPSAANHECDKPDWKLHQQGRASWTVNPGDRDNLLPAETCRAALSACQRRGGNLKGRALRAGASFFIALFAGSRALAADTSVPFGSCGWSYLQGADPVSASAPAFDDSAWSLGCAPFVKPWACLPPGTVIQGDGIVVVRRHFFNAGASQAFGSYEVRVKANGGVCFNGRELSSTGGRNECTTGDPVLGGLNTLVGLLTFEPGDNVFVAWNIASDITSPLPNQLGGQMDARVSVDLPTPVFRRSWGRVKAYYR